MAWSAPSPGRPLEAEGDFRSRGMTVLDRIRAYGPARPRHPNGATGRIPVEPTRRIGNMRVLAGIAAAAILLAACGGPYGAPSPSPTAPPTAIMANPAGYYVNFHSTAHGGGVIRGQLSKA